MKEIFLGLLALGSLSVFGAEVANQSCSGMNKFNKLVQTELFVIKDLNSTESKAIIEVTIEHEKIEISGTITNKADFTNARMFRSNDDKFRYLTSGAFDSKSGSLFSVDDSRLNLKMQCSKFKF